MENQGRLPTGTRIVWQETHRGKSQYWRGTVCAWPAEFNRGVHPSHLVSLYYVGIDGWKQANTTIYERQIVAVAEKSVAGRRYDARKVKNSGEPEYGRPLPAKMEVRR